MRVATTFGASQMLPESKEYEEGTRLGAFLAKKGFVVKCGGYGGLMEAVSAGVRRAAGECIGITLEAFEARRPPNPNLSHKIVAKSLYERLQLLIEGSELFVAQKGSIGTLNEIFMVAALKYSGQKPDIRICLLGEEYLAFECFEENFKRVVEFYTTFEAFAKTL